MSCAGNGNRNRFLTLKMEATDLPNLNGCHVRATFAAAAATAAAAAAAAVVGALCFPIVDRHHARVLQGVERVLRVF